MIYFHDEFSGSGGIGGHTPSPVTTGSDSWFSYDWESVYLSGGSMRFQESSIFPGEYDEAVLTVADIPPDPQTSFEIKLDVLAGSVSFYLVIGSSTDSGDSYSISGLGGSGVIRVVVESQPDTSVLVTDYSGPSPVTTTISPSTVDGNPFLLQAIRFSGYSLTQIDYLKITSPGHSDPVPEPPVSTDKWINLVKCVEL